MNKILIVIGAIICIAVGVVVYVRFPAKPIVEVKAPIAADGSECHESAQYVFIQKGIEDSVGSNILVKYKQTPDEVIPCAYVVGSGDLELSNIDSTYFLAFTDHFLVLDQGTAPPPRALIVYDLRSRAVVFNDIYTKPVTTQGDSITYWSKTDEKPSAKNCPDLASYTENGLGAALMSRVTVDLTTLSKVYSAETECIATQ